MTPEAKILPKSGLSGIREHWRDDFTAAISVSLVALPLGLGIALAAGFPPISGVIAAIIGGLLTTFIRGSHIGINGASEGQIVVLLFGVEMLADDYGSGVRYVLAAAVISGVIQMILGLARLGKLGDIFPTATIHGMLAAIGLIIIAKQAHVIFGVHASHGTALDSLLKIPQYITNLNPLITMISAISLVVLIGYAKVRNSLIKAVPGPIWVLFVCVPIVAIINLFEKDSMTFLNHPFAISKEYLTFIPADLMNSFVFPDFSKIDHPAFWLTVISLTLVGSVETLITNKAVDKLDPYKRKTNNNRDLFAIGLSSAVSGAIGGLPIITAILRSSVNINHGAKTGMSNFYHAIIILACVVFLPSLIRAIPQASLAAILIYMGYKLTAPKVFKDMARKGWEQIVILLTTLFVTLATDLLWGLAAGVLVTTMIHWVKSGLHLQTFLRHLSQPFIKTYDEKHTTHIQIRGISNFLSVIKLNKTLRQINPETPVIVDFGGAKLIDSTILDLIYEHKDKYYSNGEFQILGLDIHRTSSHHPHSIHVLEKPLQKRLTNRQNEILQYAQNHHFDYRAEIDWNVSRLRKFVYFDQKIIEYKRNTIKGRFDIMDIKWDCMDITYNEGVLLAAEEHNITVMIVKLPFNVADFTISKDDIEHLKTGGLPKESDFMQIRPIIAQYYPMEQEINYKEIFTSKLVQYLVTHDSHHIECVENEILFVKSYRLASALEIEQLSQFAGGFCAIFPRPEIAETG